ncbi:hypothetical protein [Cellulomonas denverensis]|uniref:Septum formation-related domain-containing protein n=1 Tax=Cellulomonas denverensis TaxID=264297 RepID=A0A7X6KU29_9CELL|nr:hypothetical protein [Cellulomonas denverensis]NKY22262.1 hypothetical protein [Cellulomonas denverensis]GIG26928.1 hypothetical protein Cde04nite_31720 [Cellulomonas denverensis]
MLIRYRVGVAAAAVALAATLGACADDPGSDEGAHFGTADRSVFEPTPFEETTTDHCLGDSVPIDGMVPVISCTESGSVPIEAVVTVGPDAPVEQPAEAVVIGYATAACEAAVEAYAAERNIPVTGLLQIAVVPDDRWNGPDTPVVCAVSQS